MSFVATLFSALGFLLVGLWVWDRRRENVSWTIWLQATGVILAAILLVPFAIGAVSVSAAYAVSIALPAILGNYLARQRPTAIAKWRRMLLSVGLWAIVLAALGFVAAAEYIRQNGPYSGGAALGVVWLVSSLAGSLVLFGRGASRVLGFSAAAGSIVLTTAAAIAM